MINTITIELCQEDRARLDLILSTLAEIADKKPLNAMTGLPEAPASTDGMQPVNEPTPFDKEPEKPSVTLEEVQAKAQKLLAPSSGKRDQVRALIKGYAERVSLIPEDKWTEVMQKLTDIEEGKA